MKYRFVVCWRGSTVNAPSNNFFYLLGVVKFGARNWIGGVSGAGGGSTMGVSGSTEKRVVYLLVYIVS